MTTEPSRGQAAPIRDRSWWTVQKFGKLRIKDPNSVGTSSRKKKEFVCECGKSKSIIIRDVLVGKTSSCGRCGVMDSNWWSAKKFGSLLLKKPKELHIGSHAKELWTCDCGKEKPISVKDVTNGSVTSCGHCNEMGAGWWSEAIFGRLRLKDPRTLNKSTNKKAVFVCRCGNENLHSVQSVTSGRTSSCGKCSSSIVGWYKKHRIFLQSLKTPIPARSIPAGGPIQLDVVSRVDRPFRAICPHCDSQYMPRFSQIKAGKSLTCGCSSGMISRPNLEIRDLAIENGYEAELEFKLSGHRYDVRVKKCKTLIEFDGSRYHSSEKARRTDEKKESLAGLYGYNFLRVKESSWRKNKEAEKQRILSFLRSHESIGHDHRCKNEILARLEEIDSVRSMDIPLTIRDNLDARVELLRKELRSANEDIISAAVSSHHVMCSVKNMGPGEAFGTDPFVYYGLGLVGEAGELTGSLLRVIRSHGTQEEKKSAVESELADCIIYAVVLAYATGIDLVKQVNDKAKIVEARAKAGYYGPAIR